MPISKDYQKGDIVYVEIPYLDKQGINDGGSGKDRTALILIEGDDDDYVVMTITKHGHRPGRIKIEHRDCTTGTLSLSYSPSYAVPSQIFTIKASFIRRKVTELKPDKRDEIVAAHCNAVSAPPRKNQTHPAMARARRVR